MSAPHLWILAVCFALCVRSVSAEQPGEQSPSQDADEREARFAQLRDALQAVSLTIEGDDNAPRSLDLIPEPVLRWSNPERRTNDGGVFLWTRDGRPSSIVCTFWRKGTSIMQEWHSLDEQPITASVDGETVWSPPLPGISWRLSEAGSHVSPSRSLRLVQMRQIASAYSAQTQAGGTARDIPLRVQPQPLYRYPRMEREADFVDGAIFSFVQATDPEVLLLLEARRNATGDAEWHIAFARMSKFRQRVTYEQTEAWKCGWSNGSDPEAAYFVRAVDE